MDWWFLTLSCIWLITFQQNQHKLNFFFKIIKTSSLCILADGTEVAHRLYFAYAWSSPKLILIHFFFSTKCHQKTVKKAYYTVCQVCAERDGICAKCAQKADIVDPWVIDILCLLFIIIKLHPVKEKSYSDSKQKQIDIFGKSVFEKQLNILQTSFQKQLNCMVIKSHTSRPLTSVRKTTYSMRSQCDKKKQTPALSILPACQIQS